MAGIFILLVLSICLALLVLFLLLCYSDYRHLKQENNHFNRMVKEQFEMNSNSLNAYEAMLREACRSQAEEYERWAGIDPRKARKIKTSDGKTEIVPSFGDNLRYFFGYQLNYMYWRYFLWNFVGRQNDLQAQGEITAGNWLSGIQFIDQL